MGAAWDQDTGVVEVWGVVMAGVLVVGEDAAGGNKKHFITYCYARTMGLRNRRDAI
jgi:hypothetical protein